MGAEGGGADAPSFAPLLGMVLVVVVLLWYPPPVGFRQGGATIFACRRVSRLPLRSLLQNNTPDFPKPGVLLGAMRCCYAAPIQPDVATATAATSTLIVWAEVVIRPKRVESQAPAAGVPG